MSMLRDDVQITKIDLRAASGAKEDLAHDRGDGVLHRPNAPCIWRTLWALEEKWFAISA